MVPDVFARLDHGLILLAHIEPANGDDVSWSRQIDLVSAAGADGVVVAARSDAGRAQGTLPYELSDFDLGDSACRAAVAQGEIGAIKSACLERDLLCIVKPEDPEALKGFQDPPPALLVPSEHLTNLPLLERASALGCPLLVGTGFASLEEVEEAVQAVRRTHGHLILLHEAGRAWALPEGINLRILITLRNRFGCRVGWIMADEQIALAVGAVALGAEVILYPGTLSAETQRRLVEEVRMVGRALGSGEKRVHESDWRLRDSRRRSIVAAVDIPRGASLTTEMLTTAPPGIGLKPRLLPSLVGKRATVDIARGALITLVMVE